MFARLLFLMVAPRLWPAGLWNFYIFMDYQLKGNGWKTFVEHYGLAFPGILLMALAQMLMFFLDSGGARWIGCYSVAVVLGAFAVALLFYAKLPLYRQRCFFTFGLRLVPEDRRAFYRGGYLCAAASAAVLACLLFSRP